MEKQDQNKNEQIQIFAKEHKKVQQMVFFRKNKILKIFPGGKHVQNE